MNTIRYQAIFEPQEEGDFTVTFPDNTSWPVAQRLERPKANPTLKQLERAAAIGKRLILSFE